MPTDPWPTGLADTNNIISIISNNDNNHTTPSSTSSNSNNSNTIIINNNYDSKDSNTDSSSVMTMNGPILPVASASLLSPSATQFNQPQQYQQEQQQSSSANTHVHAGFPEDTTGGVIVATLHPLSSPSLSPSLSSSSPHSSSVIATSPALTTTTTMAPTLAAVTALSDPMRDPTNEPTGIHVNNKEQEQEDGAGAGAGAGTGEIQDRDAAISAAATTAKTEPTHPMVSTTGTGSTIILPTETDGLQIIQEDGLVVVEEYVSAEGGSTGVNHKDPVRGSIPPTTTSSCHITHSTAVVDKERLVSQLEIVPSFKLDLPAKDLPSRKSLSLTPLQTSPTPTTVKKSIPATAIQTATMDSGNPYYSTSIAPISAATSPTSTVPNSLSGSNFHSSHSGPSSELGSYLGIESPYPSPTPASSPIDYFAASWVLPPIPSFSEMGLTFDKSRSSSNNSMTKREASDSAQGRRGNDEGTLLSHQQNHIPHATHKPHRSGTDRQSAGTTSSEQQYPYQEIVPDYDPSVFDQIISDENEAYILWSTTPESGSVGAAVSASIVETGPTVALPKNNRSGAILSPSASQQPAQSIPTPDPSSSSSTPSTVKRWSAGESSKAKNQGRDSFDNDRVRTQTPTATTPSQETFLAQSSVHGGASDPFTGSNQSSSPSLTKSPERISGSISMVNKLALSGSSASSKANAKGTAASGPGTNKTTSSQESRVIMAATLEKLVEKLTSDIGKCV
jgi:hypothetical protein